MHVTLIRPDLGHPADRLGVDESRMEPLQLAVLAALTPPDVEVALVDDRIDQVPYDRPTDLVGITVETFTARRAYQIAAEYRRRGVKVVMGGFHATLAPEEVAEQADAVYTGDAEGGWAEVLADAAAGRLRPRYDFPAGAGQRGVLPRRELFRGKDYLPLTLVQFSRGCPHGCHFCAIGAFFGQRVQTRPVAEVVAELTAARARFVFFVDDNIVANRAAAKELFRDLIPLKLRWVSQGSIDMTEDRELMDLMARSGCLGHVIGFESLDPVTLRGMGKQVNLAGGGHAYREAVEVLRHHGLQTWAAFTVGHDEDTVDSVRALVDFALAQRFTFAAFNTLTPYPGTPLYRRLAQEGRLLFGGRWWLHPEFRFSHATFVPARMTPQQLTGVAWEARARFSSLGSRVRRFLEPRTNLRTPLRMALYWGYNGLFRREVVRKQGMTLGIQEGAGPGRAL
jgi:radical SAM superfamily enzyme YgiQ (UPF0313 family)